MWPRARRTGEENGDGELGFGQNVKKGKGKVYLWPRYRQANVLRKLAASTVLLGRRILGGESSSVHERKGEKGTRPRAFIRREGHWGANARVIKPGIKAA